MINNREEKLEVKVWGRIGFEDMYYEQDAAKLIKDLYLCWEEKFCNLLYGGFSILIRDRERKRILLMRSEYGSPVDLYYSWMGKDYAVSSRLNVVLDHLQNTEKCQDDVLAFFTRYGFLPGTSTLIKNVYRVPAGTFAILSTSERREKTGMIRTKRGKQFEAEEAEEIYPELLRAALKREIKGCTKLGISLSGGYDSNYLLWHLCAQNDEKIDAFSVGGRVGRNETEKAKLAAACYPHVVFHEHLIDAQTLLHLPEIVWILEGCVFERGIFLQYELANMAGNYGVQKLIAGDGADQIMHERYRTENPFQIPEGDNIWHENPDIVLKNIILPKSTKMLFARKVCGCYPYLTPELVCCFQALRQRNGTSKAFHCMKVKNSVDRRISSILENVGGATYLSTLFENLPEEEVAKRGWKLPRPAVLAKRLPEPVVQKLLTDSVRALYLDIFYDMMLTSRRKEWAAQFKMAADRGE